LWVDRINTKKSLGTSPFHIAYGVDVVFPTHLGAPFLKCLQEEVEEPNEIHRKIFKLLKCSRRGKH
jgi:hypothetical protein